MKKVNILGQDYSIRECTELTYPKLKTINAFGLCEYYSKEIILDKHAVNIGNEDSVERLDLFKNSVIRHEIIHAFLHESGFENYRDDEVLIDWLAMQIPKMASVFNKLGILME